MFFDNIELVHSRKNASFTVLRTDTAGERKHPSHIEHNSRENKLRPVPSDIIVTAPLIVQDLFHEGKGSFYCIANSREKFVPLTLFLG